MSKKSVAEADAAPAAPAVSEDRLAAALEAQAVAIGKAVGDSITAAKGRAKVSYGDYIKRPGNEERKLKKPAFQNGFAVNPVGMSDDVINKFAELTPGKYLSGLIEVLYTSDGKDGAIHLRYKNKTPDERMTFNSQMAAVGCSGSLSDIVTRIHAEMTAAKKAS